MEGSGGASGGRKGKASRQWGRQGQSGGTVAQVVAGWLGEVGTQWWELQMTGWMEGPTHELTALLSLRAVECLRRVTFRLQVP